MKIYDGMAVSKSETEMFRVSEGKLYKNIEGVKWVVWANADKIGCPDGASVAEYISAKKEHEQGIENLEITRGDGFYDRCSGVALNPF